MIDTNMKKLLIALINKLIGYSSLNNMGVELVINGGTVSHSSIFISHYEDLLDDIESYTLYYSAIHNFNLILIDKKGGFFKYKSTIEFSIESESDDIQVKYRFISNNYNITSMEKKTTNINRLLDINKHYIYKNTKIPVSI